VTVQGRWLCDGPDCDTWTDDPRIVDEWVKVVTNLIPDHYFCNGWCAVRWLATWAEPPVPLGDVE
jgi:hypothetical protein